MTDAEVHSLGIVRVVFLVIKGENTFNLQMHAFSGSLKSYRKSDMGSRTSNGMNN
jgi:hypothetical protein